MVLCTWDDVPHLNEEAKARMLASYPEYQRDARSKGVPSLGPGAIYKIPESLFKVAPFVLPNHYKRGYGMDVGWNVTAALFGAWDQENLTLYIYDEHYAGQSEPSIHAAGISARGPWLPGRIDPASRGRGQADGVQLLTAYRERGLKLEEAPNAVEAGILSVHDMLSTGHIKVFSTCTNFFEEYRLYVRNEKGVPTGKDHLMDCWRYLILSGTSWLESPPREGGYRLGPTAGGTSSWLGR